MPNQYEDKELEQILSNLQFLARNDSVDPNGGHPNELDLELVRKDDLQRAKLSIQQLITQKQLQAIHHYRSTIIAENYDSMHKTYDYDGIAEMVLNQEDKDE